jgi:hypothetical protein
LLLIPAPSLGVLAGMVFFPQQSWSKLFFILCKIWLFALPVLWYKFIEKGRLSFSPPRNGGLLTGLLSGIGISVAIIAGYTAVGKGVIDKAVLQDFMQKAGLDKPMVYFGAAAYWVLINSVLEEYIWRWFVLKQCKKVLASSFWAVVAASGFFALHHLFALNVYMDIASAGLCAFGVFAGGVFWSWMYLRYRSIWPGWLSHIVVDICVFGLGAVLLF